MFPSMELVIEMPEKPRNGLINTESGHIIGTWIIWEERFSATP
jgi:hypothetical protein